MNHDDGHNGGRGTGMNTAGRTAPRDNRSSWWAAASAAWRRWRSRARAWRATAGTGLADRRDRRGHPARPPSRRWTHWASAARERAVFTDHIIMMDAVDAREVVRIDTGEDFRAASAAPMPSSTAPTSTCPSWKPCDRTADPLPHLHPDRRRVAARRRATWWTRRPPLPGRCRDRRRRRQVRDPPADGGRSGARHRPRGLPGRGRARQHARGTAHQRARALGRPAHLVHYPRGGQQYNLVVTFHSREQEEWGVRDGSKEEVLSYFQGIHPRPHQMLDRPTSWKRGPPPTGRSSTGARDASRCWATPRIPQYMAQGACMALEDAVTLGEAVRACGHDLEPPSAATSRSASRSVVWSTREMGRFTHAASNAPCAIRCGPAAASPSSRTRCRLYGWKVEQCLAGPIQP